MSGGMPQFNTHDFLPQIAWLAVAFCVLYQVIKRSVLPSLDQAMIARRSFIDNALRDAEDMQRDTERLLAEADALCSAAAMRANALTDRVRIDAAREAMVRTAALDRELAFELEAALQEVDKEHGRARSEIVGVVDEVTAALAQRLRIRGAA